MRVAKSRARILYTNTLPGGLVSGGLIRKVLCRGTTISLLLLCSLKIMSLKTVAEISWTILISDRLIWEGFNKINMTSLGFWLKLGGQGSEAQTC